MIFKNYIEKRRMKKKPDVNDQIRYIQEEMKKYEPGTKEWISLNLKLPEYYQRQNEAIDNSKRRGIKIFEVAKDSVIGLAGVAVSIGTILLYDKYVDKGLKYEETGVIGSSTVRNIFSKIRIKLPFFK